MFKKMFEKMFNPISFAIYITGKPDSSVGVASIMNARGVIIEEILPMSGCCAGIYVTCRNGYSYDRLQKELNKRGYELKHFAGSFMVLNSK